MLYVDMDDIMYKLLDLYCGAGGAAIGYDRAGFDVTGVDINPQPNYPFSFICADALEFAALYGHEYDVIHASPLCQSHSRTKSLHSNVYPDQLPETRELLKGLNKPYIIENVPGAPLHNPIALDGTMFDLKVIKKRLFESNFLLFAPPPGEKKGKVIEYSWQRDQPDYYYFIAAGNMPGKMAEIRAAMGIKSKMTRKELNQAIPPEYTKFVGKQIINILNSPKIDKA